MSRPVSPLGGLVWKELRQLQRSRGAILSATLLPLLVLVATPLGQLFALRTAGQVARMPASRFPVMADFVDSTAFFINFLFPLFVAMGGLLVPSIAATYTVIAERERRTLELLTALPVRVSDVLMAKIVAMLVLTGVVVVPMYLFDAVVLLSLGIVTVGYVLVLLLVLLSAMVCSLGVALLLALLARDFRTANNINGAMIGPLILLVSFVLFGFPGFTRFVILVSLLVIAAAAAFVIALRWLTFERYLA